MHDFRRKFFKLQFLCKLSIFQSKNYDIKIKYINISNIKRRFLTAILDKIGKNNQNANKFNLKHHSTFIDNKFKI